MNLKNRIALVCMASAIIAAGANAAKAEEKKFEPDEGATIKRTLEMNSGKTVSLRLTGGGDELTGTVGSVGNFTVHIKSLQRREFYDAVVELDRIDAVIFRVK